MTPTFSKYVRLLVPKKWRVKLSSIFSDGVWNLRLNIRERVSTPWCGLFLNAKICIQRASFVKQKICKSLLRRVVVQGITESINSTSCGPFVEIFLFWKCSATLWYCTSENIICIAHRSGECSEHWHFLKKCFVVE